MDRQNIVVMDAPGPEYRSALLQVLEGVFEELGYFDYEEFRLLGKRLVEIMQYMPSDGSSEVDISVTSVNRDRKRKHQLVKAINRTIKSLTSDSKDWQRSVHRSFSKVVGAIKMLDGSQHERLERAARKNDDLLYKGSRRQSLPDTEVDWREQVKIEQQSDQPFSISDELELLSWPYLYFTREVWADRMRALKEAVDSMEPATPQTPLSFDFVAQRVMLILESAGLNNRPHLFQRICSTGLAAKVMFEFHGVPLDDKDREQMTKALSTIRSKKIDPAKYRADKEASASDIKAVGRYDATEHYGSVERVQQIAAAQKVEHDAEPEEFKIEDTWPVDAEFASELSDAIQEGLNIVMGHHSNVVREIGHVVGTGAKRAAQPIGQDDIVKDKG